MQFLQKIITSFSLVAISFLNLVPQVLFSGSLQVIVLGGNTAFDACNTSIQCEETEDGVYVCDTTTLGSIGQSLQNIPFGKSLLDGIDFAKFRNNYHISIEALYRKQYIEPLTFVYPFVRITKIQV